jgi:ParB family chromosome partitioning protein
LGSSPIRSNSREFFSRSSWRDADGFTIIAGERRYRAAVLAGLTEVPVIVRRFSEEEKLEIALIENIQGRDLTPIEEAKAIKRIHREDGKKAEEIAEKIGKNRSTVANALRLLKLPQEIKKP